MKVQDELRDTITVGNVSARYLSGCAIAGTAMAIAIALASMIACPPLLPFSVAFVLSVYFGCFGIYRGSLAQLPREIVLRHGSITISSQGRTREYRLDECSWFVGDRYQDGLGAVLQPSSACVILLPHGQPISVSDPSALAAPFIASLRQSHVRKLRNMTSRKELIELQNCVAVFSITFGGAAAAAVLVGQFLIGNSNTAMALIHGLAAGCTGGIVGAFRMVSQRRPSAMRGGMMTGAALAGLLIGVLASIIARHDIVASTGAVFAHAVIGTVGVVVCQGRADWDPHSELPAS